MNSPPVVASKEEVREPAVEDVERPGGASDGTTPASNGQPRKPPRFLACPIDLEAVIREASSTPKARQWSLTMKWPGISVGKMMFAVAILAADFALFYHLERFWEIFGFGMILFIGLLPMVNILAFGLPRLLRLGRRTPFAVGFQITSWVSTFAIMVLFVAKIEVLGEAMPWLFAGPGVMARGVSEAPVAQPPVGLFKFFVNTIVELCATEGWANMAAFMVLFSLPPFLFSLAGGLVARYFVRRRSRSVIVSPLPGMAA
jgi:hypothetical protein